MAYILKQHYRKYPILITLVDGETVNATGTEVVKVTPAKKDRKEVRIVIKGISEKQKKAAFEAGSDLFEKVDDKPEKQSEKVEEKPEKLTLPEVK